MMGRPNLPDPLLIIGEWGLLNPLHVFLNPVFRYSSPNQRRR